MRILLKSKFGCLGVPLCLIVKAEKLVALKRQPFAIKKSIANCQNLLN